MVYICNVNLYAASMHVRTAPEAAQEEAQGRIRELEKVVVSCKRDAEFARSRQRESEQEVAQLRREVVKLERSLLLAKSRC